MTMASTDTPPVSSCTISDADSMDPFVLKTLLAPHTSAIQDDRKEDLGRCVVALESLVGIQPFTPLSRLAGMTEKQLNLAVNQLKAALATMRSATPSASLCESVYLTAAELKLTHGVDLDVCGYPMWNLSSLCTDEVERVGALLDMLTKIL